jgi:histidinol dehydrogenase
MPLRLDTRDPGFAASFAIFLDAKRALEADVDRDAAQIIADVRARGDAALADFTRRFDRLDFARVPMRVARAEIEAAEAQCDADALSALAFAAGRIADYHRRQVPQDLDYTDDAGVRLGWRWRAIAAVGV